MNDNVSFDVSSSDISRLPNRYMFYDKLNKIIYQKSYNSEEFTVMIICIDDYYKLIIQYGMEFVKTLINHMSDKLCEHVADTEMLAIFEEDALSVVFPEVSNRNEAELLAKTISEMFDPPMDFAKPPIDISISIGVAIYPEDGSTENELSYSAYKAMFDVKHNTEKNYQFHSSSMSY